MKLPEFFFSEPCISRWSKNGFFSLKSNSLFETLGLNHFLKLDANPFRNIPPEFYIDEGVCPFEGGQYGSWKAREEIPLLISPAPTSRIVAMVEKDTWVTAESGFVRTKRARFIFNKDRGHYKKKDVISVYTYYGEGFFLIWKDGCFYEEDLEFGPYSDLGGVISNYLESNRWGRMLEKFSFEWWAKIHLSNGLVGWTNKPFSFGNKDAFE